ncbi:MAG: phosphoglucosamine mutase [Deltaproteobacteria bacterium]|nr:phosphoglucosamine mutase [Deltaproteobacteria bacterium]
MNVTKPKRHLFGTDGIRGIANTYPMTAEVAMKLGRALTTLLKEFSDQPRIIVGKDTRLSGYMLETALTAGITSMGGYAHLLGPLPTPAVAYLVRSMRAQGGVMISASHNPYQDNGLKVFGTDGFKLDDKLESRLEHWMESENEITAVKPTPERLGRARRIDDASGRYLTHLKTIFRQDFDLQGKKIVFDGANGAAYDCGVKLFQEMGAEVITLACAPNGRNINADCAQADPKLLADAVLKSKADLGIGVDGDADRLMVVDETGVVISGEHLLYAMAEFLKDSDRLTNSLIVTTTMANQALEIALSKKKITTLRTEVGDRYVTERMRAEGSILGGETSGHFIFLDQNTTADGLFSALEVLALLHKKKVKASSLRNGFELLPQKLVSVKVKEKIPVEKVPSLSLAIQQLEKKYDGQGRVNVRYSGTESVLRMMVEGPDLSAIESDLKALVAVAQKELG